MTNDLQNIRRLLRATHEGLHMMLGRTKWEVPSDHDIDPEKFNRIEVTMADGSQYTISIFKGVPKRLQPAMLSEDGHHHSRCGFHRGFACDCAAEHAHHPAPQSIPDSISAMCPYSKAEIDVMVSRFLSWKLPDNFSPDGGITFRPNTDTIWPIGTNLLTHNQTVDMILHILTPSVTITHDKTEVYAGPGNPGEAMRRIHERTQTINRQRQMEQELKETFPASFEELNPDDFTEASLRQFHERRAVIDTMKDLKIGPFYNIEEETAKVNAALEKSNQQLKADIADAIECFWNAALGQASHYQDSTAQAAVSSIAVGLAAVAARLKGEG